MIDARRSGELAARAQWLRGETFFHQKNYHEALREFLKVDILYRDCPSWQAAVLLEAGKVYERLDQWDDAADTYKRLRAKFPDDPDAVAAQARLDATQKAPQDLRKPPARARPVMEEKAAWNKSDEMSRPGNNRGFADPFVGRAPGSSRTRLRANAQQSLRTRSWGFRDGRSAQAQSHRSVETVAGLRRESSLAGRAGWS